MITAKMQQQRGVCHSTGTGRQFGIDFESMGHMTWMLLTKNCRLYMNPIEKMQILIENVEFSIQMFM